MKRVIAVILILLILTPMAVFAEGEYLQALPQGEMVDIDKLKNSIDNLVDDQSKEIIPALDLKQLVKDIATGKVSFSLKDVLNNMVKYFFKEIYTNLNIILKIIVLVLLCALLQNLQSSFGREGVGEVAFYACYIFIASLLIKNFLTVLDMGRGVIDNMVVFMQAFIPTLFTLMITTGNITTSTILQPSIIFSIEIMSTLIKNIILPLILFYTVLAIVNNISNKVQISKLADLIKNIGIWTTGIFLTIFIAVITLQSTVTSMADGVTTKTAKYATSTFIPIVGKILSDAVDTVLGYSIMLKNSVSIVGMLIILAICLVPIIKLFALIVIYKLASAMIQPVSDERIVKCISEMAGSLTFILASVISVATMFLITVSIMINAGNTAMMMR